MEKQRRALLEAAMEEFSEVGLSGSSLDSIAGRVGLAPSVARALFVDKEQVFQAVLKEWTEPLVSAIGLAVEKIEDPKELIHKALRLLDRWLLDNRDYVRLLQRSALDEASTLNTLFQTSLYPSEFFERLHQHVARGEVRGEDPVIVFLLLDSLIFYSHMIKELLELMCPDETAEQLFERRFDAVMGLLEHGIFAAR